MAETKTQYKTTLNLPKTDFPMKANLSQREPGILQMWEKLDVYQKLRQMRAGCDKFILNDGPPYANGPIHIGHAVNKTLKDVIVKSKNLSGYDAPYVPGWDCHGLPIELNVEKKKGKPGVKIDAYEFRDACRDYAKGQLQGQREAFKRLGVMGDWDKPYLTMDFVFEANVIRSLGKLIQKGHLQKGHKPVHWCIDCGSALAEAEVEYKDKESPAIDIRFVLPDAGALAEAFPDVTLDGGVKVLIPVWTTTPWTLPANEAVALHPELDYVLVEVTWPDGKEVLLLAEGLQETVMARYAPVSHKVLATCRGEALVGLSLQHPFYDKQVPVVLAQHVNLEAGTGAVHTAPAHGPDDYLVALQYDLPVENPVAGNGCYHQETPLFAGEHILKSNGHIIEVMKEKGTLLHEEKLTHSYPHCWRHKTPVIFRATPQWFISLDAKGLRADALKAIEDTQWFPAWGEARIQTMVANRPDWCISRQRAWGVPIPLVVHHETHERHPDSDALIERVAQAVEKEGVDAWHRLSLEELVGEADAPFYEKVTDVLDVWFDSGVVHECVLQMHDELEFPADLYLEGSDQHRGWFQSSLLTSVGIHGVAPYKAVLTHGFTVDAQGRKMSKSLGNVIAPEKVIKTLGADILRLWVASADYQKEMSVSDEILKRSADAYRRIRNTARFLLSNLHDFDPKQDLIPHEELLALDKWAVETTHTLQTALREAYDNYHFHQVVHQVHHFCVVQMGSFYLDIIKDRQYTMPKNSRGRRSAQTAMYHILQAFVRWLMPVLSFTAEEIWQLMPGAESESVMFATWYEGLTPAGASQNILSPEAWQQLMGMRDAVNKEIEGLRRSGQLGAGLEAMVTLYCNDSLGKIASALGDELRFVFITSGAKVVVGDAPAEAVDTEVEGLQLAITVSTDEKCERCWHRRPDVGEDSEHPTLCQRCVTNLTEPGEGRQYA